jgi:hypothetical protein
VARIIVFLYDRKDKINIFNINVLTIRLCEGRALKDCAGSFCRTDLKVESAAEHVRGFFDVMICGLWNGLTAELSMCIDSQRIEYKPTGGP